MWLKLIVYSTLLAAVCCSSRAGNVAGMEDGHEERRGVIEHFNDGLKLAGKMFGINTAADVANLVAQAFAATTNRRKPDLMTMFQHRQGQQQQAESVSDFESEAATESKSDERYQESTSRPSSLVDEFSTGRLIGNVLKVIGFDATKLGALAINAFIMIAQAIGQTLMGSMKTRGVVTALDGGRLFGQPPTHTSPDEDGSGSGNSNNNNNNSYGQHEARKVRAVRPGSPIDWFLAESSPRVRALIDEMTNRELPDRLADIIGSVETEPGEAACLKLLMCKSAPFIWGMQKSLAKRLRRTSDDPTMESNAEAQLEAERNYLSTRPFYAHMPSLDEYRVHEAGCRRRFIAHCDPTKPINLSPDAAHL